MKRKYIGDYEIEDIAKSMICCQCPEIKQNDLE